MRCGLCGGRSGEDEMHTMRHSYAGIDGPGSSPSWQIRVHGKSRSRPAKGARPCCRVLQGAPEVAVAVCFGAVSGVCGLRPSRRREPHSLGCC